MHIHNSLDAPIALKPEHLENFHRWFGDSKVRDEQGRPLVVHHGTDRDFRFFDIKKSRSSYANNAMGFFFHSSPDTASMFSGEKSGSNLIPAYLNIQNPYRMTSSEWMNFQNHSSPAEAKKFRAEKERAGHDGIVSFNEAQWVAFHPHQIKSAIGNNGNFDPTKHEITEERNPMNEKIRRLIDAVKGDRPLDVKKEFGSLTNSKIAQRIEEKKRDIAQKLFAPKRND